MQTKMPFRLHFPLLLLGLTVIHGLNSLRPSKPAPSAPAFPPTATTATTAQAPLFINGILGARYLTTVSACPCRGWDWIGGVQWRRWPSPAQGPTDRPPRGLVPGTRDAPSPPGRPPQSVEGGVGTCVKGRSWACPPWSAYDAHPALHVPTAPPLAGGEGMGLKPIASARRRERGVGEGR